MRRAVRAVLVVFGLLVAALLVATPMAQAGEFQPGGWCNGSEGQYHSANGKLYHCEDRGHGLRWYLVAGGSQTKPPSTAPASVPPSTRAPGKPGRPAKATTSPSTAAVPASDQGTLPKTGSPLPLVAAAGTSLVLLGSLTAYVLRRRRVRFTA
jgi:LPXTG-motif cell wall-anchored protein